MKIYEHIYIGDEVLYPEKLIKSLKIEPFSICYYCIILLEGHKHIEIYNMFEMQREYIRKQNFLLIGIASNQLDAMNLIVQITNDSLAATGKVDLIEFILNRNKI